MEYLTLYHYTPDKAAESIIETGELWLTDANSLNDGNEIRTRFEIFKRQIYSSKGFQELDRKNRHKFFEYLVERLIDDDYFLACFCRSEKNPHLWQNYANGNAGRCLVFKVPLPAGHKRYFPLQILPMQYQDADNCLNLQEKLDSLIYPEFSELESLVKRVRKGQYQKILHKQKGYLECRDTLIYAYINYCLRTKSKEFQPEQEWRLIASNHLETWFDRDKIFFENNKRVMKFIMPEGFLTDTDYILSSN